MNGRGVGDANGDRNDAELNKTYLPRRASSFMPRPAFFNRLVYLSKDVLGRGIVNLDYTK